MGCIRKFFVATDTFLGHQVRIGTAETRRAVLIVYVDHQTVLGTFHDCFVHPFSPHLRSYLYETEFQSGYSPGFIQWENLVQLLLQSPLIDVEDYSDAMLFGISYYFFQVQCVAVLVSMRINGYCGCIGGFVIFGTIPTAIEMNVLQVAFHGKVDQCFSSFCGQRHFTHHLSGFNPGSIFDAARRIQVQEDVVMFQYLSRFVGTHDYSPRSGIGGDVFYGAIHCRYNRILLGR